MKALFLALLGTMLTLSSCTKDAGGEELRPTESVSGDVFSIEFERVPVSYAAPEASLREKQITSVAVFVETVTGQFYKFLSTEAAGTKYAFQNVKTYKYDDGIEQYDVVAEAQLEMPHGVERFSRVAVVSNYAVLTEQYAKYTDVDFTDALLDVDSWDELTAVPVPASQVNGVRTIPGLVSSKILDPTEVSDLWDSGKVGLIKLQRLAARLRLNVSVWADPGDGNPLEITNWVGLESLPEPLFRFHTISFYHPKQYAFLFPEQQTTQEITDIPQFERFEARRYEQASTISHYVYPMTGDEAEPLRLYADFSVRPTDASEWTYYIGSVEIENEQAGKCLLEANHAYEVDFKFTFPVDPATLDTWDSLWYLTGRTMP